MATQKLKEEMHCDKVYRARKVAYLVSIFCPRIPLDSFQLNFYQLSFKLEGFSLH